MEQYIKLSLHAHEGYSFYGNKASTTTTLYDADGHSFSAASYDYNVYGENNEYMDIILGMECTQRRAQTLMLLDLNAPSEGDPLDTAAKVEPKGISIVSIEYTDDMGNALPASYIGKAGDTVNVAVKIAAGEDIAFEKDLTAPPINT